MSSLLITRGGSCVEKVFQAEKEAENNWSCDSLQQSFFVSTPWLLYKTVAEAKARKKTRNASEQAHAVKD